MNYDQIAQKAKNITYEDGWDDSVIEVPCPTYDLYVDEGKDIFFGGAIFEDGEDVPSTVAEQFAYSLIQAGFLADPEIKNENLETIDQQYANEIVEILPSGDIRPTPLGEARFSSSQSIKAGLEVLGQR